jgi:cytoskeletal protein CcmA (bactofilin family)
MLFFMKNIKRIAILLGVCSLVLMPGVSRAAEIKAMQNVSIAKSEVVEDNLYVAEQVGIIEGTLKKDLVTAGGNLLVTGTVERDIIAAGGTLELLGDVGGNVRVAGGTITIGKEVGGDLVIAGGMVHIASGATIKGDVIVAAGQLIIDGTVKGGINAVAKDVTINGAVGKNVSIKMNQRLSLGKDAKIEGDLAYRSIAPAVMTEGATVVGKTDFQKIEQPTRVDERARAALLGLIGFMVLVKLLAMLVVSVVAVVLFKKPLQTLVKTATEHFGREMVRGFVVLIVVPVAILIAFISLVGMVFGVIGMLSYILLIIAAKIVTGILFGAALVKLVKKTKEYEVTWQNAVIGTIAIELVCLVPVIGWVVAFLLFLASFGSVTLMAYQKMWMKR